MVGSLEPALYDRTMSRKRKRKTASVSAPAPEPTGGKPIDLAAAHKSAEPKEPKEPKAEPKRRRRVGTFQFEERIG